MSMQPSGPEPSCEDCAAAHAPGEETELRRGGNADTATATQAAGQGRKIGFQFSISTLLLMMTLAAVVLSVFQVEPGVTVLLVLLAAPALLRTWDVTLRRQLQGQALSPRQKIALFLSSLVLVVAIIIAVIVTLAAVGAACCAIAELQNFGAAALPVLAVTGCLAAVCVVVLGRRWGKESSSAGIRCADELARGERR